MVVTIPTPVDLLYVKELTSKDSPVRVDSAVAASVEPIEIGVPIVDAEETVILLAESAAIPVIL